MRPIRESAQPYVESRGTKARRADLSKVLNFKEDFCVSAIAIAMNYGFAFFVVFGQRPRADPLRIARAKTGPAIGIEHVAGFGFIKDSPNFQAFAQFPTAAMQHRAAAGKLRRLAVIFRALSQKVDGFLARHFQSDGFERCVHYKLRAEE